LPRQTGDEQSKERYISRFLGNPLIDPVVVMGGFIPEMADIAGSPGKTMVLSMDQSKISDGFEGLRIAIRVGERAIPRAWKGRETSGGIGFDGQESLLGAVYAMLPKGRPVLLTGDRFYGSAALIRWCGKQGWPYRRRLKDNPILPHEGGEITTGEAATAGMTSLLNAVWNETGVKTHSGILHEKGHKEPWIIARSDTPSQGRVLDDGMRWGMEPLFSDFKSRGFGIAQTQLQHASRIERLILVLTVALYWAASTGRQPKPSKYTPKKKKEV
jgi:hypothetical protein